MCEGGEQDQRGAKKLFEDLRAIKKSHNLSILSHNIPEFKQSLKSAGPHS